MKIEIDTTPTADSYPHWKEHQRQYRAFAAFCLMLAGDIEIPSAVETAEAPTAAGAAAARDGEEPPVPARTAASPALNILSFPTAPPVPVPPSASAVTATPAPTIATSVISSPPVPTAVPPSAPTGVSAGPTEYDSAGLPWDSRIHQKGRSRKKDGTWKLQKGLEPNFAQSVVQELISRRIPQPLPMGAPGVPNGPTPAAVSAPPSTLGGPLAMPPLPPPPLPVGSGPLTPDPTAEARAAWAGAPLPPPPVSVPLPPSAVPVPPLPNAAPVGLLPPPPAPLAVPASPPAPVASSGGGAVATVSPYKQLIDKLTVATQNKTLNPASVVPAVQHYGVPNMGSLSDPAYAALLPKISHAFDCVIAGLPLPPP